MSDQNQNGGSNVKLLGDVDLQNIIQMEDAARNQTKRPLRERLRLALACLDGWQDRVAAVNALTLCYKLQAEELAKVAAAAENADLPEDVLVALEQWKVLKADLEREGMKTV